MPTEIMSELAVPSGGEGSGESDNSCWIGTGEVGLSRQKGEAWEFAECTDTDTDTEAYGDCVAGGIGDGWLGSETVEVDPSAEEGGDGRMCLGIRTVKLPDGSRPFFLLEGTARQKWQENWERFAVRWVRRAHWT